MSDLQGKVAIVTGAGQGIGLGISKVLASRGVDIVVVERVDSRIGSAVDEVKRLGRRAVGVVADVTDDAMVRRAVAQTIEAFGKIDVLVNNAGTDVVKSVVEMTDAEWNVQIDVNLKGTFQCCRAALPHMIERKQGAIVNIASAAGWLCYPRGTAYSAAKAGVMAFTRSLAGEVASSGIRVNAVAPGPIDTPLAHAVLNSMPPAQREALLDAVVLRRWGKSEEIATAVAFLASSDASYVTGETLSVSGGMFMH